MKKVLTAVFALFSLCLSAQSDTLVLNYYSHSPFAYTENGVARGIEVDIMNEFILWMNAKKKINVSFRYKEHPDFSSLYVATKSAPKNTIGLGSATISQERLREVDFTAPYLKNVAFCITNGNAPDVKTKNADEIMRALGSMNAITLPNTSLNKYVNELKRMYIPDLKVVYQEDEEKILDEVGRNVLSFGYVDAIEFWFYVKNNPHRFLKMQKILSQSREEMGFILPKGSQYKAFFNEFFAGPTGFKTMPGYRAILEKHLGSYMTQNVAVN